MEGGEWRREWEWSRCVEGGEGEGVGERGVEVGVGRGEWEWRCTISSTAHCVVAVCLSLTLLPPSVPTVTC